MNTVVFDSINDLRKVFTESQKEYLFIIIPKDINAEMINVAKSYRNKMIEILIKFYKDNYQNSEGVDDFVTLFGVYCNYYILYGLHLVLKEDDLGTTKIFENISDDSLKKYLSLIRSGIYTQDFTFFKDAIEENNEYSLAHFYLFLSCLRKYYGHSDYKEQEKELLNHYKAIRNEELKKYAIGRSNLIPNIDNYIVRFSLLFLYKILEIFQLQNDDFLWSYFRPLLEKTKEKDITLLGIDAPFLPTPSLVTSELKQRMGHLLMTINSYMCSLGMLGCFNTLLNNNIVKELSEVLSFIANEKTHSSTFDEFRLNDKFRSNLHRFFSERKPHPVINQFINYIFYILPDCLNDIVENISNIGKENPTLSGDYTATSIRQSNLEMEEIYLGGQTIISEFYESLDEKLPENPRIDNQFMYKRSVFLGITFEIKWTNQELFNLMERISVQDEKNTMVKDFMHTYSNMKADALYDIAQLLLKRNNPEDKKNGRNLLLEYAIKKEISNSVYMMQLMYKNSVEDIENLKKAIEESLVDEEDEHESVSDVLNKSLIQCFINIFYIDPDKNKLGNMNSKINKMRTNFKQKKIWGETFLGSKREQFEQQFTEKNFNCLAWLLQEGINFTFEQEPIWERIFLEKEGFSSTFFKIIFDELCVNVFKYGNLEKEIRLCLSENENEDLVISFSNYNRRSRVSDSKIGLNLLRRRIQILHENPQKNCVEIINDEYKFQVKLFLPKVLFFY